VTRWPFFSGHTVAVLLWGTTYFQRVERPRSRRMNLDALLGSPYFARGAA